ncbi:MAG: AAA family ATPase, partial [Deltaproteobacteria bacterium]|nr:AAA family ATPase [Deltaproteobacteria bacterium]
MRSRTSAYRSELDWLDSELRWVEVRLRRLAAQAALERSGGARRRGYEDPVTPEDARRLAGEERRLRLAVDRRLAAWRAAHGPTAFDRLADSAGLDAFERTVLLLAVAAAMSTRFGELFGEVGNFGTSLTPEAAFRFAEKSFTETIALRAAFGAQGRLVAHDLVAIDVHRGALWPDDVLGATLRLTSSAFNHVVGDARLDDAFLGFSRVEAPLADLDGVVLADDDKRRILNVLEHHDRYLALRREWGLDDVVTYGRGLILLFHGAPGTGKTLTAHAVAKRLGMRVLNVDIPTFVEARETDRFLPALFREARMRNAVLFFDECEVLFADRRLGNPVMTGLLTELERFEGVAILATNLPAVLDEALDRRILVKVRFPEPDREARAALWRRHLPPQAPLATDVDVEALADRYELSGGYIKNAVLEAVASAAADGTDAPRMTMAHLEAAARHQGAKLSDGTVDLVAPKARLADVVLPAGPRALVEELVAAARGRRTVLDRWRIGDRLDSGKGPAALFTGEPGTGKTHTAHAVAGELGRSLLEASVATLLSKWVGESERNLAATFRQAREHGAVLFLDECDSLLTERGADAARHDDRLVGVFLRLLERHDGLVLLAPNREGTLDRALSRRIAYRVTFPMPDATARAAIWRGLLPATVPTDGTVDPDDLGRRFALSGGRIRNAVFKAAFRAASRDGGVMTAALLAGAAAEEVAAAGGNGKA